MMLLNCKLYMITKAFLKIFKEKSFILLSNETCKLTTMQMLLYKLKLWNILSLTKKNNKNKNINK